MKRNLLRWVSFIKKQTTKLFKNKKSFNLDHVGKSRKLMLAVVMPVIVIGQIGRFEGGDLPAESLGNRPGAVVLQLIEHIILTADFAHLADLAIRGGRLNRACAGLR